MPPSPARFPGARVGSEGRGRRRQETLTCREDWAPLAPHSQVSGPAVREGFGAAWSWALGEPGTPSAPLSCALSPAPGTPRHHPQPQASAPLSHVARSRQTTPCHPRSPPLLSLWHFTGYSAARRPPTPSAHVLQRSLPAPTSPDGPRPPGNLWTQAGRCRVLPSTSQALAPRSSRGWCHYDVMCAVCCISCVKMYFVVLAVVEPWIVTFNIREMCLFPGINHWLVTGLDPSAQLLPLAENLPKSLASFQPNQPTLFPFCVHVCAYVRTYACMNACMHLFSLWFFFFLKDFLLLGLFFFPSCKVWSSVLRAASSSVQSRRQGSLHYNFVSRL